jgi:hypothetical protein
MNLWFIAAYIPYTQNEQAWYGKPVLSFSTIFLTVLLAGALLAWMSKRRK